MLAIAWAKRAEHDGGDLRAWLYGIARKVCANVRRKHTEVLADDPAMLDVQGEEGSAWRQLRRAERERVLHIAATRALDPGLQLIFWLRHVEDLPRPEIARLVGLGGPDEVRVALQRARRLLVPEIDRVLAELGHGRSLFRSDDDED